jgi:hypothetical protein
MFPLRPQTSRLESAKLRQAAEGIHAERLSLFREYVNYIAGFNHFVKSPLSHSASPTATAPIMIIRKTLRQTSLVLRVVNSH